ncbi:PKD-like family protein [Parapedobacter composti]|uniref:PKD-like family protein n=1 Tax=Parapedobacter composti TaxID=623281 RepID=A0A1I1HSX2_9SPHI|nr:PKD-like family lipoprotein [Parapedobacter composti]SFC26996.1 PKD-like family protein [Parapedobacter composti]
MKTIYQRLVSISLFFIVFAGCKDDLSSLDTDKIAAVEVDTVGQSVIYVFQFETLVVDPKINTNGLPAENLVYEWMINSDPGSIDYLSISNEKKLEYEVSFRPTDAGDSHQLLLKITDTQTDLEYLTAWPLIIRNSVGEGVVIAETHDGTTTDISHLMSPQVTPNYNQETIRYNVFSSVNGYTLPGLVQQLRFTQIQGSGQTMLGSTSNSLFTIKTLDYTFDKQNEELFYAPQSDYGAQFLGGVVQNDMMVINNQLYANWLQISKYGLPFESAYPIPAHIAINGWNNYPNVVTSFYSESHDIFVYQQSPSSFGDRVFRPVPAVTDGPFNPNDVPRKINVAAGVYSNGDFLHLLKDEQSGELALYVLAAAEYDNVNWVVIPSKPRALITFAGAPEVDKAEFFLLLDDQNVVLYATKNKIYAAMYGTSIPTYALRYTTEAGEEITSLKVYQQADYPMRTSGEPYFSRNNRQLIMGTFDGDQGRLYIMPLINQGEAWIDVANIKRYSGFGRILTTATQR